MYDEPGFLLTVCAFRCINILYNAQALHPDGNTNTSLSHPLQEQNDEANVSTDVGLVLSPLRFDSQASFLVSRQGVSLTDASVDLTSDCFVLRFSRVL
jgi:hypothetical protein